ncbi:hypothetical protein EG242_08480 [Paenimyroides viscosum]|uniref:Uncharacterized protein n=1 Tax=Paenimyroides viscosum TaxID=2488729 RepID=A0A3P1B0Q5_9FLAO|nr:hypothetical protein EG242_08480 [Paenimyroides viscosum]
MCTFFHNLFIYKFIDVNVINKSTEKQKLFSGF